MKKLNPYLAVDELLELVFGPNKQACQKLLEDNRELFESAPGSSHNHQAWRGGYLDHVTESMNIAVVLYRALNSLRPLPFSLSDALLVLFLHDLEKPWKYYWDENGNIASYNMSKEDRKWFREGKMKEYGIRLTPEQEHMLKYVEGVRDSEYTPGERTMEPNAAFVHMCDLLSARLWHDQPSENDPWSIGWHDLLQ